jgi:non-ribosomal peptide synthetase component F
LSQLEMGMPAVKVDLTLNVQDTSAAVHGAWLYSADLFTTETMQRMTRHLRRVLETAVAEPETNLRQVREMLAEDDRQHRIFKEKELQKASLMKLHVAKRKVVVGSQLVNS